MREAETKQEYLAALDFVLGPRSFHRRRKSQEWRNKPDDANELWIHINFGKAIVNPSVGVRYSDLESMLPQDLHFVSGATTMLQAIVPSPAIYRIDEGPARVGRDLLDVGIPFLDKLTNRELVIERLRSSTPSEWPTLSYSDRIRLLPLLLAAEGRVTEASKFLDIFSRESLSQDQINPRYELFARALRKYLIS